MTSTTITTPADLTKAEAALVALNVQYTIGSDALTFSVRSASPIDKTSLERIADLLLVGRGASCKRVALIVLGTSNNKISHSVKAALLLTQN
ncbi:hypothetical protein [Dongia sp.]|uniref:hypothetical protein n=1 Tax=Dongia sp. TaxID=1977262 RepID=UPI0035B11348